MVYPVLPLNSWFWLFCENYVYAVKEPPARVHKAPMEVLAVGVGRSATESLKEALVIIGIPTYHGWDVFFEEPCRHPYWVRLMRRKFYGDGDSKFTAEDFDHMTGDDQVVADVLAFQFAPELIEAYPEVKVILNHRKDLDAWQRSWHKSIGGSYRNWIFYFCSFFHARMWWAWHGFLRFNHAHFFMGVPIF